MPEFDWGKLSPHTPLSRASDFVGRMGGEIGPAERTDTTFHQPLFDASMLPVPGPQADPPPRPSEQMLRDILRTARAAEIEAELAVDNAQAAHARAKALVETSSQELGKFESLEGEIAAETTEALRQGSGRYSLPNEVKDKLVAREVAKAAFAAADTAEQQLADDLASARDRLAVRTRAINAATAGVLAFPAEAIATQIIELRAALTKKEQQLLGYDRIAVSGSMLPLTRDILYEDNMRNKVAGPEMAAVWREAAETLRLNPEAEITIREPTPPPPAPPVVHTIPMVAAVFEQHRAAREAQAAAAAQAIEEPGETKSPPEAA